MDELGVEVGLGAREGGRGVRQMRLQGSPNGRS